MTDYDPRDNESEVHSQVAPAQELVPVSLVATLTKAEIDQQIATAHAFPRSPAQARDRMIGLATLDDQMAEECIYSVPRGGKTIRGPSIRFAEIVLSCWGNIRCAARVSHEDRIERYVEAEAIVHDLESNVGFVARARRPIQMKRGKTSVDADMTQLAGAAAISVARRNAILGAVPKPVWSKALAAVESVIRGDVKTLVERRDAAISYFNKAGVTTDRILKALEVQHLDDISLDNLVDLNGMRSALKTGEASLDTLFPVERDLGPKPENLTEKLQRLSHVDAETGEIKESGAGEASLASGGAGAAQAPRQAAPASPTLALETPENTVDVSKRGKRLDPALQAAGDAAALKGVRAFEEWFDSLSGQEVAQISAAIHKAWVTAAAKVSS
jgi:hypothetical protein